MDNVYVLKQDLDKWVAKYFKKDIITIEDLIDVIGELDDEIDDLKEQLEDLKNDMEQNYRPIPVVEQY